jgi:hypothetical protein
MKIWINPFITEPSAIDWWKTEGRKSLETAPLIMVILNVWLLGNIVLAVFYFLGKVFPMNELKGQCHEIGGWIKILKA